MTDRRNTYIFPVISLNLKYDLTKDWDYNTRSIYAYIVLSVEGEKESHEIIMWDKVMMTKEDSVFDDTIENKYILFNDDPTIIGKKATITFCYQIQPTVGIQRDYVFDQVQEILIKEQ